MDGVVFDRAHSAVCIEGEFYRLTDIEYMLLRQLVDAGGALVYRSDLVRNTWGLEMACTNEALRQRMSKLDKKLGHKYIHNVYGWGYRFSLSQ